MKKAGARKALKFFEDNYIMICNLETKDEEGCANKCLEILKKYVNDMPTSTKNKNKINFMDIKEKEIAIHFTNQKQLVELVDYLKAYDYEYGTGGNRHWMDSMDRIKDLGCGYFSSGNQYLTLDRSKNHYPKNYVSCGLGYKAIKYDFKDIEWDVSI